MSPALAVEGLAAGYEPGLPIVKGATLAVAPNEIVTLLGPNGAGKSTLVKAVAGLVPVSAGRVLLEGSEITGAPPHGLVGRGLAFVPQTDNVFANLGVEENLELAGFRLGRARRERIGRLYTLFPDLQRQRRLPAGRLSGGQRQMLAVARALIVEPRVLMLDEPSAGLSPRMVETLFERLAYIRSTGLTILMVEQNVRAALEIADRAVVLVDGRERLDAPARDIAADTLRDLYLGRGAA
ncbi:MAG TPA: ABC transporter ATP-binding protein [Geminicoccaceae bacterium]|nr:ABC transporter ATP-binding protein [Geminicoccus sp.]HMU52404.1 ABC transporter ATP-binding protein [Geminicoccaceae bacterium]